MKKWSIDFFSDNVMDCQVETWTITDGVVSFETDSNKDAEWLCDALNEREQRAKIDRMMNGE